MLLENLSVEVLLQMLNSNLVLLSTTVFRSIGMCNHTCKDWVDFTFLVGSAKLLVTEYSEIDTSDLLALMEIRAEQIVLRELAQVLG